MGVNLIRPIGTLYYSVPEGVNRFAIQIEGQGSAETVKAIIRDASGRIVDQQDNIAAPHVFVLERKTAAAPEIWSVTLEQASEGVLEDVSIQTLGVPSIFAATPGDLVGPSSPE